MQDIKRQFSDRLRKAMADAGYVPRPAVLEREFNTRYWGKPMTLHGVRRWLMGETMPDHRKLATLAEWLQVPVHQLSYGEGQPLRTRERPPVQWHSGLGYQDRELFEIYLRLPVPKRHLARDVILAIARAHAADDAVRSTGSSDGDSDST
ncbi:XRE family transcriptional regulator [Verminephrobacter aporrectodeae]|uniref:XRE family transcriptional regulator n=2 Tax=Verminephrobacter TaxID=364316 RepID=A0ABT3KU32_9BURK|nr:XRE family transcriptional regulator [Verminephrobacter aporrectodeae]MCW5222577.1 XRE family transcriptional regulator [Verminephrobacter aporrectodeae subsp. tuberculatae]MCW5257209.1 XRE family transcriptional regulator [Verminephrobacter aporrectodeae subsp. tuberculatae]MCW5288042.1 XRE family transcriptional regulator [Verminephrobacter aporrectodeae subsp. tuberculatae]MCW5321607.1 XRE family transcriptional regulator [Verminephrobacter aporrectodeae subsp. tuberculatae]MCW8163518.1 